MHQDHCALRANRRRKPSNRTRESYSYEENKIQCLSPSRITRKKRPWLKTRELNYRQQHVPAEHQRARTIWHIRATSNSTRHGRPHHNFVYPGLGHQSLRRSKPGHLQPQPKVATNARPRGTRHQLLSSQVIISSICAAEALLMLYPT